MSLKKLLIRPYKQPIHVSLSIAKTLMLLFPKFQQNQREIVIAVALGMSILGDLDSQSFISHQEWTLDRVLCVQFRLPYKIMSHDDYLVVSLAI